MALPVTSAPPTFVDSVNQQFFIESQGGSQHPISYLDRFPESIYTKSIDSLLVKFLYSLLGPVGLGQLRQEYLEARLAFEDAGLDTFSLDQLYTSPFAFARVAEETYSIDASASLLTATQRNSIVSKDAAFRNRAMDFFKGVRAGGTVPGLTLVARSGSGRPVTLIENYKALYDQFSDDPLNLPYMGSTTTLGEVIVLPRQTLPKSSVQSFSIVGQPVSGWFSLTLPIGPTANVVAVNTTTGSNVITVPNAAAIPPNTFVSITSVPSGYGTNIGTANPVMYAMAGQSLSPTTVQLVYPPSGASPGANFPVGGTPGTGSFYAYVGNATTVPLPYNATATAILTALQALPVIGRNNITVSGGPLPDQPITIRFQNNMADRAVPTLLVNLNPDVATGIGLSGGILVPPMVNAQGTAITTAPITVDKVGISSDNQVGGIAPIDQHAMQVALDQVRPITSIITTTPAAGVTKRQPANTTFSGSTYTEVLRYVTGNASTVWPRQDSLHWIEAGKEHEAPRTIGDTQHHYQGFHNIVSAVAYTENALGDPYYENPALDPTYGTSKFQPVSVRYYDTLIGNFSATQMALYPVLENYQTPAAHFDAGRSIAASPDPLEITKTVNGVGIVNGVYPNDYLSASALLNLETASAFWASAERNSGTDFLELDLGRVQAVNYLYFEATTKPYLISVAYDVADLSPKRSFRSVTIAPPTVGPSILNLSYDAANTNPWETVTIFCSNALNRPVYTRFIRIGFSRNPAHSPFAIGGGNTLPYSIEVRNLRIGRNIV